MRLSILIPVYNEERTLKKVFEKIEKILSPDYELIIVNDASTDGSLGIIKDFAKNHKKDNVTVINHENNKGKGAGIKSAIKVANGKYFVIQDADLEYDPSEIPPLLEHAELNDLGAVYGSRFKGSIKGMASVNYYANKFYNFLLRRLYPTKITDMHTCYKMVDTKLLGSLHLQANGFGYAPELVSKLLKRGVKIEELPITFNGRTKKEGKKIDVLDGVECVLSIIQYRYGKSANLINLNNVRLVSKFAIVGGVGFVTNYLILKLLKESLGATVAEIVAVLGSLQITFLLHDRWTYVHLGRYKKNFITRYSAFIATNLMGGVITALLYSLLHLSWGDLLSLLVAAVAGLVWNFAFNTLVTWRVRPIRPTRK